MKKKVLNLYAGIGGNRKLWTDCEVTAVEYNSEIAAIYKDFFPQDDVIVGDAHDYLLKHYKEFDFIWTSPPCPTHSDIRRCGVQRGIYDAVYIDFKLWQEIVLLQHFGKSKWVVENVMPYYDPIISPSFKLDRHHFWANFRVSTDVKFSEREVSNLDKFTNSTTNFGVNLKNYKIKDKRKLLRNMVNPEVGLHIFNQAMGILSAENTEQLKLAI